MLILTSLVFTIDYLEDFTLFERFTKNAKKGFTKVYTMPSLYTTIFLLDKEVNWFTASLPGFTLF